VTVNPTPKALLGLVERIGLADLDPYIAGFWETVFFDCDWLCQQVEEIEVTLETWERLKHRQYGLWHHRVSMCGTTALQRPTAAPKPGASPADGH
jgi:hypothetical protein